MATGTPWYAKLRGCTVFQDGEQVAGGGRVSGLNFIEFTVSYDPETGLSSIAPSGAARIARAGETASIGAASLLSSPAAGLFEVDVHISTTTAGSAGTVLATIAYTDRIGSTSQATTTLALDAQGRLRQRMLVYVASGDITYATTVSGAAGSPQYALDISVRRLSTT